MDIWNALARSSTRASVLAGFAVCALAVGFADVAEAGTYHVYGCRTPSGGVSAVDGWRVTGSGGAASYGSTCGSGGSMYAALDGSFSSSAGDQASAIFAAPSNTDVAAVRLWRAVLIGPSGTASPGTKIQWETPSLGPTVAEQCNAANSCSSLGTTSSPMAPANLVNSGPLSGISGISAIASCSGSGGTTCPATGGPPSAAIYLYAADVTLRDTTSPIVSNVQGGLVSGGTLSGAQSATFDATDTGSGIYSVIVDVDGQQVSRTVLDNNGGRCVDQGGTTDGTHAFEFVVPCKLSLTGSANLDTAQLADGTHQLQLFVDDAAGNATSAYAGQINVHNGHGTASGSGGGTSTGGGLPGTALPHTANGATPCAAATLVLRFGKKTSATVSYGKTATLQGQLVCGSTPVRGAVVAISAAPIVGTSTASASAVTTSSDGSFSYVAGAGPSRNFTATYRAYADDAQPAATATAVLSVTPRITLKVTPRNARNHRAIVWRGRVSGGPIPAAGVPLDLQYRDGRRWRTFDQLRSKRDGTFSYRYVFRRTTRPTIYSFRVAMPSGGVVGYPYSPASSGRQAVRVRP